MKSIHVKDQETFLNFFLQHKVWIFLILLFFLHIFLRFYQIETKSIFRVDQLENAWAAKRIIVDHQYPLIGPTNKLGSGLVVGPLYFYLISIFYYFTNLDPIAAGLFAGATSIFAFLTIFIVTKKLFSFNVAFIALFINTVSYSSIFFDRVQWEIDFVPVISLLAFFFLYKLLNGHEKSLVWLSIIVAFSFHIHLTVSVFLPIIILLTSPFFPKNKKMIRYILYSTIILLIGLSPLIIANIQNHNFFAANSLHYANSTFHGIHATRILQLLHGAFIQIESFFGYTPLTSFFTLFLLPIFFIVYFLNIPSRKSFVMVSLVFLWFLVPWIVLATYSGEVTDYYFSTNRFVGLIVLAYLIEKVFEMKNKVITIFFLCFACYYAFVNIRIFLKKTTVGIRNYRVIVKDSIKAGTPISYNKENPLFYLYYVYTRKK